MPNNPDKKEIADSVTIFQGLLFEREHRRPYDKLTVITDIGEKIGEEDIFFAVGINLQKNQYVLHGDPGGLHMQDIGKLVGSLSLEQLIDAAENRTQNTIVLNQNLIQDLQMSATKGPRILVRHK